MRGFDPLLAAEQTNTAYIVFRELRLRRRNAATWRERWSGFTASIPTSAQLVPLAITLITALLTVAFLHFSLCFFTLPISFVCAMVFRRWIFSTRVHLTGVIGTRVSGLISVSGMRPAPLIDLWMSGINGRGIAEAITLEHREHLSRLAFLPGIIITTLLATYFIIQSPKDLPNWIGLVGGIAIGISSAVCGLQAMPVLAASRINQLARDLEARLDGERIGTLGGDLKRAVLTVTRISFWIILALIVSLLVWVLLTASADTGDSRAVIYFVCLVPFVAAGGLLSQGNYMYWVGPRKHEEAMEAFDRVYTRLILHHLAIGGVQ